MDHLKESASMSSDSLDGPLHASVMRLDTKKLCCNLPKIQTKRQNLRVFHQKDANGIANSEDPDQTAPLGAV